MWENLNHKYHVLQHILHTWLIVFQISCFISLTMTYCFTNTMSYLSYHELYYMYLSVTFIFHFKTTRLTTLAFLQLISFHFHSSLKIFLTWVFTLPRDILFTILFYVIFCKFMRFLLVQLCVCFFFIWFLFSYILFIKLLLVLFIKFQQLT